MRALALLGELLLVALCAALVRRFASDRLRPGLMFAVKGYLTVRVMALILLHEVEGVTVYQVLRDRMAGLDATTFVLFVLTATIVKLVGIAASITRWILMLRGQGIELPLRHIVGAFFIGRFLGTFLPSTLGLDGYKLYDAARFSGRTLEVSTATLVEKLLGASGIFGTFLIALPLGVGIFGDAAPLIAAAGIPIALAPLAVIAAAFLWPGPILIHSTVRRLPLPTLRVALERIAEGATAYARHKGILLSAWGLSLVQHFTTAAMYYFTARALGVQARAAGFWEVTFASSIQIFATVITPFTIAGEGIRELAQGLLLRNEMTFAVAAASGLLGFLAAEAPTLLGAIPWFLRGESYRPDYCRVGGVRVDYAEARRRATDLGLVAASETGEETPEPLVRRIARAAGIGTAVGLYAGLLIGVAEASYLLVLGKVVEEAQVFWAAPLGYGLLFASAGLFGGAAIGCLPLPRAVMERWLPAVGFVACLVPYLLAAVVFLLRRDLFAEKLPPIPLLGGVAAAHALLAVGLLAGIRLLASTRARGALGIRAAVPVFLVAIALGGALGARFGPAAPALEPPRPIASLLADRPNVLLVIVDTLRADALRLYADSGLRTPALERLAEEGTVYRAAFSQASWTKPSIATILTSLYPSSHMATLKPSRLPDSIVTLAEAFRGYGYTTGGIVTNINLAPSFNFHQGFDEYRYLVPDYLFGAEDSSSRLLLYEIARRIAGRLGGGVRPGQAYQPAEVVNEAARAWLDRHGAERFFLLLHYMEPHDPYFAHPDDGRAISRATTPDPDPALRDEMLRRYRSEIEYFDLRFGELLEDLERRGLYDELLVVVTSDHGEEFLDHEGWWHGLTLYDEQIGVPLVAKWPASARPDGARRDGQVRSIDIAPTVLSFVGAPVPPAMQGESLLDGPTRERVVYAEEDHEGNVLQAIRREGLKLIRANPGNPRGLADLELYDVAADPRETRNVLEREHARAEGLLEEMVELGLAAQAHGATAQTADITPEECERLRALGYVGECP